jgi:hypothetical protein
VAPREIRVSIVANFARDPDGGALLRQYGEGARALRDLYVQMQCYCKLEGTDGFVPEGEIGVLAFPSSPTVAARDIGRLVDAKMVERGIGGYLVPAYLDGNSGRPATPGGQRQAEGARRANHERWHRKRGEHDPECQYCTGTDQFTDQSTDNELIGSHQSTGQFTDTGTDQFTDPEATTDNFSDEAVLFQGGTPPIVPPKDQPAEAEDDPRFTEFWAVYPLKRGKPRARKAWRAAMRRRHDPDLIIKAAREYRDDPKRKPDFTAHASTWLNDERYNDEHAPAGGPLGYPTSPWEN